MTAGLAFYDVPLAFNLIGGQRYDIAFQSIVPAGWGNPGLYDIEFYGFNNPTGISANGYTVGAIQVLDGDADQDNNGGTDGAGATNGVMPHVRLGVAVTATPEPATMVLFGTGLAALAAAARRRRTPV